MFVWLKMKMKVKAFKVIKKIYKEKRFWFYVNIPLILSAEAFFILKITLLFGDVTSRSLCRASESLKNCGENDL